MKLTVQSASSVKVPLAPRNQESPQGGVTAPTLGTTGVHFRQYYTA